MNRSSRGRARRTSLLLLGAALVYPAAAFGQAPAPSPSQPAPSQPAPADPDETGADVIDVDSAPPPVPKDKGVISGTVVESSNGEPIIEAQVTVVGTKYKALTDLDGKYRLEVPPGTYDLRVFYEGHKPQRVQKAAVAKGQTLEVDVTLQPESAEPEPVREIEVAPDRTSAATQILIRKNAANVGDAVSAQEIARTPDRNAAEAAKRVVGATVLDGRFVFVRGLGERYTNALLNGSPLPSPEPDRQAVPLDLFPALVLSDISILKTFTPDMPGDFAGGSVSIHTRQPTDDLQVSGTVSLGFNTESTFKDRLSYQGGNLDFLGIDSGKRALPRNFPKYQLVSFTPKTFRGVGQLKLPFDPCATASKLCVSEEETWAAGRMINDTMTTNRSLAPPNHGVNFVVSGTKALGSLGKLGATAALSYSRKFTILRDAALRRFGYDDPAIPTFKPTLDSSMEVGNDQVSWGGLAVVSWSPSNDHRFTLTGLTSRFSDNEARFFRSNDEESGSVTEDTRLRFVSRGLFFGELGGEHKIRALKGLEIDYHASASLATLDEPHTREMIYSGTPQPDVPLVLAWDSNPNLSGSHFYASQMESSYGGSLDVTQPVLTGSVGLKLKAGAFLQVRERKFTARRFKYDRGSPPSDYTLPPDQIFTDENIGVGTGFTEWTFPNDQWTSSMDLYAGYFMADFSPVPWLRALGGVRVESWSQSIETFNLFQPRERTKAGQDTVDGLPAVSLVFKTTKDSNIRASFSRTVARPQLRELSPVQFLDLGGQRVGQGNPNLEVSQVTNADLRFELFPGAADVVAVSAFFKDFQRPIESMLALTGSNDILTFCNTKNATVLGMEVEVRKGLGFISPALSDLSPLANVTVSSSRVNVDIVTGPDDTGPCSVIPKGAQTSAVRPLVGQSPVVVNLGLDYSSEPLGLRARVVYNVSAPRLRFAGANGLLDTYEQPRHLLDLAIAKKIGPHFDLKLTAENLLQQPFRLTFGSEERDGGELDAQGNPVKTNIVMQQQPGTTFTLSATITN